MQVSFEQFQFSFGPGLILEFGFRAVGHARNNRDVAQSPVIQDLNLCAAKDPAFEHLPRSAIQTSDQKCGNRTLVLTRSSIFTAIFCLAYNLTGCEIAIRPHSLLVPTASVCNWKAGMIAHDVRITLQLHEPQITTRL